MKLTEKTTVTNFKWTWCKICMTRVEFCYQSGRWVCANCGRVLPERDNGTTTNPSR